MEMKQRAQIEIFFFFSFVICRSVLFFLVFVLVQPSVLKNILFSFVTSFCPTFELVLFVIVVCLCTTKYHKHFSYIIWQKHVITSFRCLWGIVLKSLERSLMFINQYCLQVSLIVDRGR